MFDVWDIGCRNLWFWGFWGWVEAELNGLGASTGRFEGLPESGHLHGACTEVLEVAC